MITMLSSVLLLHGQLRDLLLLLMLELMCYDTESKA